MGLAEAVMGSVVGVTVEEVKVVVTVEEVRVGATVDCKALYSYHRIDRCRPQLDTKPMGRARFDTWDCHCNMCPKSSKVGLLVVLEEMVVAEMARMVFWEADLVH